MNALRRYLCDAQTILRSLPDQSIDCWITSPPYWGKRYYDTPGIGNEATWQAYIDHLLAVCAEIRRVLKPTGSFWLNLGDTYYQKIPCWHPVASSFAPDRRARLAIAE